MKSKKSRIFNFKLATKLKCTRYFSVQFLTINYELAKLETMKKLTLSLYFTVASAAFSFSQSSLNQEQVQEYFNLSVSLEGTYQIQMINTRALPTIRLDLFPQIDSLRLENETTYLNVNPNMRIMILPREVINASNFVWVERVIHINGEEL